MSFAAQAMLRNVEAALRSAAEAEIDPVEDIRNDLIRWRDSLLAGMFDTGQIVLLSHAIAHLARLQAVENAMRRKD